MRKAALLLLMAALFLFAGTQVHADLTATFDTGDQGWTGSDPVDQDWGTSVSGVPISSFVTAGWQSSGGNPGGYLMGAEVHSVGGTGYFMAPSSWNGSWSQYVGGTLKYDINIIQGSSYFNDPDVIIYNGPNSVSWRSNLGSAWSGWETFTVPLTATTFGTTTANFDSVMSDVTGLWIRGEYIDGPEAEGLDNVIVSSPVPIPGALLLFGPGLAGLAAIRRRFKK